MSDSSVHLFSTHVSETQPSEESIHAFQALPASNLQHKWIMDSGASHTMSSNCHWFHIFTHLSTPITISLGGNSTIHATGIGHIHVCIKANQEWHCAILQDVLFVPDLHGNLLSVTHVTRHGANIQFIGQACHILDQQGNLTCEGHLQGNLYLMDIHTTVSESAQIACVKKFPANKDKPPAHALVACSMTATADVDTWHRCLGHLHINSVLQMVCKGMVKGMEISGTSTCTMPCEPCFKGKQTHAEIQKHTETCAEVILGCIFSDVCGKLPWRSHKGFKYFMTFINDKSRKVFIAGLHQKSDVAQCLRALIAHVEVETGQNMKALCTDSGSEYTGTALTQYLTNKGTKQELTTPDTLQHNGIAKCMNWTLLDKVWAILLDANLPEMYWFDALEYATLLHNVTPTWALDASTPEEVWSGNKPNVSHLRVFGCWAFIHIPDKLHGKLATKSLICTFIGYAQNHKAYHLVHHPTRWFLESHDIIFDEGKPVQHRECIVIKPDDTDTEGTEGAEGVSTTRNGINTDTFISSQPNMSSDSESETEIEGILTSPPSIATSRPKCTIHVPTHDDNPWYTVSSYGTWKHTKEHASVVQADTTSDPQTYAQAMARSDAAEWELACNDKHYAFEHMGIYEVISRLKGWKVVGSKWVFHIKCGPDGAIQKYKAHVIAQGFTQIKNIDYNETFAPIAKFTLLHTILAIAAEEDLEVHQMDVKSAYLSGILKEEIFMELPPGFDVPEGMVLHLVKAVYGMKQGGHIWYENIRSKLEVMGYKRTKADHAVFAICRTMSAQL
jgi:reverse transcriptase-like protein/Pol polyprotein/gag-pre-integrase-like protein/integrase-like protein